MRRSLTEIPRMTVRFLLSATLLSCCLFSHAQSFIIVNKQGGCAIEGKELNRKDTINISSIIKSRPPIPSSLLIREINSEKAYSFTFSGDKKLRDILYDRDNLSYNLREYHINKDVAVAARETNNNGRAKRDIIYHNRIEFDIARVLIKHIDPKSDITIDSPYNQYWWDLLISADGNRSRINLVNYNDIPLYVCAVMIDNLGEKEFTPLTNEAYIVNPLTEVEIPYHKPIFPDDSILLISSTENINPIVICQVLPIAEGNSKSLPTIGFNYYSPVDFSDD